MKNGVMEFCKIIEWVYSKIERLKNKHEDSSRKVDTL